MQSTYVTQRLAHSKLSVNVSYFYSLSLYMPQFFVNGSLLLLSR